jgi:hypothetical protein
MITIHHDICLNFLNFAMSHTIITSIWSLEPGALSPRVDRPHHPSPSFRNHDVIDDSFSDVPTQANPVQSTQAVQQSQHHKTSIGCTQPNIGYLQLQPLMSYLLLFAGIS